LKLVIFVVLVVFQSFQLPGLPAFAGNDKINVILGESRGSTGAGEACLSPTEKPRFEPLELAISRQHSGISL
jgi:hypothetical protein